jgi:hypothetical protein
MDDQNRNLILATALSMVVILIWFVLFPPPEVPQDPNAPTAPITRFTVGRPAGELSFEEVPGADTPWQLESGETLGVGSPVTLVWDNGAGLIFRRTISVDETTCSPSCKVENPPTRRCAWRPTASSRGTAPRT